MAGRVSGWSAGWRRWGFVDGEEPGRGITAPGSVTRRLKAVFHGHILGRESDRGNREGPPCRNVKDAPHAPHALRICHLHALHAPGALHALHARHASSSSWAVMPQVTMKLGLDDVRFRFKPGAKS